MYDQLLTSRKTAGQRQDAFTLCVPLATLEAVPDIEENA